MSPLHSAETGRPATGPAAPVPCTTAGGGDGRGAGLPRLSFAVASVRAQEHAAVPTVAFRLSVTRTGPGPVRSVLLTTAIRIAVARASYEHADARALAPLFGQPEQWATSMRPLAWARLTTVVPPFDEHTDVDLAVACTGDTGRALHTYFRAVGDIDVPLDLLHSGTVFHTAADGRLAATRLSWDTETTCRLPAALWHDLTARYFGPGTWLRLARETGERLDAYGAEHGLPDHDRAVAALLDSAASDTGTTGAACNR